MVSIEGMLDFKCSKCGESMNPVKYLGEIAKIVFSYREQLGISKSKIGID
ncbi:MAG: hypothetical protein ACFE8N_01410 [Promethearchaeota archaeon]